MERELTAAVQTAIGQSPVRPVFFFEGEYDSAGVPAYLRLHTGVGTVSWDGKDWIGAGQKLAIAPIRESRGLEAIAFSVSLSGLPASLRSIALQSMRKNRPGKIWLGFYEPVSYLSLPGTSGNYASTPDSAALDSASNVHPQPLDLRTWQTTGNNCTLTQDSSQSSPVGGIPMKMVVTGADPHQGSYNTAAYNLAPALAGQTWTASVYVKADQATTGEIFIFGAEDAGNYVEAPSGAINIGTEWTRVSVTKTLANALTRQVQCRVDGTPDGSPRTIWWDGLQVERAASASTFNVGELDIRVKVALNDWTPAGPGNFWSKWFSDLSYRFVINGGGTGSLGLLWSSDGSSVTGQKNSTVAVGAVDGAILWLRAVLNVNNGAAGHDVKFYTSDDGVTWTQLGATVTTAGGTSIFNGVEQVEIGSLGDGTLELITGKVYYAEVRNGIDGEVVAKFDPRRFSSTNLTAEMLTGETWTINQSGSPAASVVHLPDELIADPYAARRGRFDTAAISRDGETMTIEVVYEDRLVDLERARERRYTHEDQQLRLAGDLGFQQVPELQDAGDVWGAPGPVLAIPRAIPGGRGTA